MNKVNIRGTITSLPIIKETKSSSLAKFIVKLDELDEKTNFVKCIGFGEKITSYVTEHARQGSEIEIEGKLYTSVFTINGIKQYSTEILIMELLINNKNEMEIKLNESDAMDQD